MFRVCNCYVICVILSLIDPLWAGSFLSCFVLFLSDSSCCRFEENFGQPSVYREDEIVAPRYRCPFTEAMNFYKERHHLTIMRYDIAVLLARKALVSAKQEI